MNAVATPIRPSQPSSAKKPIAAAPVAAGIEIQTDKLLEDLTVALDEAANTDEAISHSGESDRLLRVAHQIADDLHINRNSHADGAIENRAFTIAALIKAAVQVPGDRPSPERLRHIAVAQAALATLADSNEVLDGWDTYPTEVRPVPQPAAPAESDAVSAGRDAACAVICQIQAACEVLRLAQGEDPPEEVHAIADLVDLLFAKHADANEAVDFGDWVSGVLPSLQVAVFNVLALCKRVNCNSLEYPSLYAVIYLLEHALETVTNAIDDWSTGRDANA